MNSEIEQVYSRLTPSRWQKGVKLLDRFLYETSPVSLYHAMLDKMRVLQRLTLSDRLFHELLAKAIRERVESHLSPVVCSYRRGMGRHTVFQGMAEFLKTYKARVRDPKARRLFVLRMDVSSYTDNIPVGEAAPVWKMLAQTGFRENSLLMKNLKRALRPVVIPESGLGNFCQWIGIPTGSPLTPILANLYLNEFDREMSAVPGAFYRRYGDDMIFIHEDERQFLEIRNAFPARLKKLGLQVKTEKVRSICLDCERREVRRSCRLHVS